MFAVFVLVALCVAGLAEASTPAAGVAPWDAAAGCTSACFNTATKCFKRCRSPACEDKCGDKFVFCNCNCGRKLPCDDDQCYLPTSNGDSSPDEQYACFLSASDAVEDCKKGCESEECNIACYRTYYSNVCGC